jgi:CHAT domain-containing protein/tetratricopeptide (TPR) repeat protein
LQDQQSALMMLKAGHVLELLARVESLIYKWAGREQIHGIRRFRKEKEEGAMKLQMRFALVPAVLLLASSVLGQTAPGSASADLLQPGIVVERVVQGSEGEKAGLKEGDVLFQWTRGTASGTFTLPLDLNYLEVEQRSRGEVAIKGLRDNQQHEWKMGSDVWGVRTRPRLSGQLLSNYAEARALAKAGKLSEAVARLQAVADNNSIQPDWLRAWFSYSAATTLADASQWKETDALFAKAVQTSTEPQMQVQMLESWGLSYLRRNHWGEAERSLHQALEITRNSGTGTLTESLVLLYLGTVARNQEHLAEAESYLRQSLAIRGKEVPGSLDEGAVFIGLGTVASDRGDLAQSEVWSQRFMEICRVHAPGGASYAAALFNLGSIARRRGDLTKAETYYREAAEVQQKVASMRRYLSYSFLGLGNVARTRGDWNKAEGFYKRALALQQEATPINIDAALTLTALGGNAEERGDLQEAEKYIQRGIDMQEKLQPDTTALAESRAALASVKKHQGDLEGARRLFASADEIFEKTAPDGMTRAEILSSLGDLFHDMGKPADAEKYYRHSLAIFEKLAPGSIFQADAQAGLAGAMKGRGQLDQAAELYAQALATLETQTVRLGGDAESRTDFRAKHAQYYANYVEVLIALNHPEKAFEVLERSRARTLLETLASAHVDVDQHADATLVEKERSLRADINAKSDRRIRLLGEKDSGEQIKEVNKEIADLLAQVEDVDSKIRISNPAYAALTQPRSLTARDVQQQLLDPNTVLLEYSLGEARSYVFAVGRDSLEAFELPRRAEIEKAARGVYEILTTDKRGSGAASHAKSPEAAKKLHLEYTHATRELSRMLLGALAPNLKHKRLLIVADGALQYVPFAALPEPMPPRAAASAHATPLIVRHEIVNLPSASVLALLRHEHSERGDLPNAVAVLADPVFDRHDTRVLAENQQPSVLPVKERSETRSLQSGPEDLSADSIAEDRLFRSATDVGINRSGLFLLPRLRYSRMEAQAITAAMPAGKVMLALDFDANRSTATSPELAHYGIIHFATHGLVDSEHPELSGLVLSMVDKHGKPQDGFLQLQDIYNLKLPANLVVLSACETALGKEIKGEGMIGLTRGFMYAGASRVVASLWKVSDVATATLMADFYRAMEKDGMPASAALRTAQINMWKQKRWSDPYFWAAFQIQGEWR